MTIQNDFTVLQKRFIAFIFFDDLKRGGWRDVLKDRDNRKAMYFATREEAESFASSIANAYRGTYQVVDLETREIVVEKKFSRCGEEIIT